MSNTLSPCCAVPGCPNRHVSRSSRCYDHNFGDDVGMDRSGPARLKPTSFDFDVVCLLCSQRRPATGTEAQATWTRQHLAACPRCRGPQVVERSDLGGISSPQTVLPVRFGA